MFTPPPIPPWEGLHPIVVHFPIALLLMSPLFVLLSMLWRKSRAPLAVAALLMLIAGCGAAQLAVMTGEAADEAAESASLVTAAADVVLEQHEELAEQTRTVFAVVTLVFAGLLGVMAVKREHASHRLYVIGCLIVLAGLAAGSMMLANTGHLGGRLVHEFGVRAPITGGPLAANSNAAGAAVDGARTAAEDDDD